MVGRIRGSGSAKGIRVAGGMVLEYTLASTKDQNYFEKMQTTYPLKIQEMRSKGKQPRFYVSFPLALAAAIGLEGGETVQWELLDRGELHLVRPNAPTPITRRRAATNPL
jgi:hypothetical protein